MSASTRTVGRSRWRRRSGGLALAGVLLGAGVAGAGEADVVGVTAKNMGDGSWRFDVTVRHADTGWKHYANAWEVVAPEGTVLGTRELLHPHEHEQPFTRSLTSVRISAAIRRVRVRAHDKMHDFGGREMTVELIRR